MQLSKHGQNFKFLDIFKSTNEDHYPRIVPIAGEFPGITEEQLLAPYSNEPVPAGTWAYDFSAAGSFACPPSSVVTEAEDPVAIVTTNTALGIKVAVEDELECVCIVDRGDRKFDAQGFFLYKCPEGVMEMGSATTERKPEGYTIMGRLVITAVPWHPGMEKKSTGFLEDE